MGRDRTGSLASVPGFSRMGTGLASPSEAQGESGTLRETWLRLQDCQGEAGIGTAGDLRDAPMGNRHPTGQGSVSSEIKARFIG